MMNVFICDDEKSTCAELENFLLQYAEERTVRMNVDVFYSGDAFMKYLNSGNKPNVLFLDIRLPGMNGIDIGQFIRGDLEDEQMIIVYISSKTQYAMELFKNRPFDFMIKPLKKREVFRVLDNIYKVLYKETLFFKFQNKKTLCRIPYKDILYFQSEGKKINIVMFHEVKTLYGKLNEMKLPDSLFLNIHKSYRINYNHVKEYSYEKIIMINGDILNISKVNRVAVRRKILERETDGLRNF